MITQKKNLLILEQISQIPNGKLINVGAILSNDIKINLGLELGI